MVVSSHQPCFQSSGDFVADLEAHGHGPWKKSTAIDEFWSPGSIRKVHSFYKRAIEPDTQPVAGSGVRGCPCHLGLDMWTLDRGIIQRRPTSRPGHKPIRC